MELQDSPVEGGVLIIHQFLEGKHEYEVKSVIKEQRKERGKFFLRRGDRLRLVNETDVQDVPPEELAQILSLDSPKLTVHKTIKKKEPADASPLDEDVMYPFSKEEALLHFSPVMRKMEDPEEDNLLPEEDICTEENEEINFLVVTMKKTSISVLTGRSCDTKEPCRECHKVKCEYNDIVMVTESSTVTLAVGGYIKQPENIFGGSFVSRGSGSFRILKDNDAWVEHIATSRFIRSLCSQKRVYVSQTPERITIYYYKSETVTQGLPVVLNFSGSDCFLKCCKDGERVLLEIANYEKQYLKKISRSDQSALAYVFYMKSERTKNTTFESALHTGWFIQIKNTENVEMVNTVGPQVEKYFRIFIQTQ